MCRHAFLRVTSYSLDSTMSCKHSRFVTQLWYACTVSHNDSKEHDYIISAALRMFFVWLRSHYLWPLPPAPVKTHTSECIQEIPMSSDNSWKSWLYRCYRRAGNFRKVYISRSLQFDRIRKSLSREFVNITIQTHNTSTQIVKMFVRTRNREILFCEYFPLYGIHKILWPLYFLVGWLYPPNRPVIHIISYIVYKDVYNICTNIIVYVRMLCVYTDVSIMMYTWMSMYVCMYVLCI